MRECVIQSQLERGMKRRRDRLKSDGRRMAGVNGSQEEAKGAAFSVVGSFRLVTVHRASQENGKVNPRQYIN